MSRDNSTLTTCPRSHTPSDRCHGGTFDRARVASHTVTRNHTIPTFPSPQGVGNLPTDDAICYLDRIFRCVSAKYYTPVPRVQYEAPKVPLTSVRCCFPPQNAQNTPKTLKNTPTAVPPRAYGRSCGSAVTPWHPPITGRDHRGKGAPSGGVYGRLVVFMGLWVRVCTHGR